MFQKTNFYYLNSDRLNISSFYRSKAASKANKSSFPIRTPNARPLFAGIDIIDGHISELLKKKLEAYDEGRIEPSICGEGLFSRVFQFQQFNKYVIKESKTTSTFSTESVQLQRANELFSSALNIPQFIARVRSDSGKYYLVSDFMPGQHPDPSERAWTPGRLRALVDDLFTMDKAGFSHGDLNNKNILLKEGDRIGLIDFEFSSEVPKSYFFEKKERLNQPAFTFPSNIESFENSALPNYILKTQNKIQAKEFLVEYLKQKSRYHAKRAAFIKSLLPDWPCTAEKPILQKAIDFETAQSRVLANPSESILRIEAHRIQFLNAFRQAYKTIDRNVPKSNPIVTPSAYLYTLHCIQQFRQEVAHRQSQHQDNDANQSIFLLILQELFDQHPNKKLSQDELDYLKSQAELGNFWANNLKIWTLDNFSFVSSELARSSVWREESIQRKLSFAPDQLSQCPVFTDVCQKLGLEKREKRNLPVNTMSFYQERLTNICSVTNRTNQKNYSRLITSLPVLDPIRKRKEQLTNANYASLFAYKNQYTLDVLTASLYGIYCATELKYNCNLLRIQFAGKNTIEYLKDQEAFAESCLRIHKEVAQTLFDQLYQRAVTISDLSTDKLFGYEGMNNFSLQMAPNTSQFLYIA